MKDLKIISALSSRAMSLLPVSYQKSIKGIYYGFLPFLQSNLEFPTILAMGMFLQLVSITIFPFYLAAAPTVLFLCYKLLYLNPKTLEDNWLVQGAKLGRRRAQVPNEDGSMPEKAGTNGVVCFVLGSQSNSPRGAFDPTFRIIGDYYGRMFREAESDPDRWGFLTRTPVLSSQAPGRGSFLVTLSYWRSLDHLRDFAHHSLHAEGMAWWNKTRLQWPHVGIFHETFVSPPGHYETIYENVYPFGMGTIGLSKKVGDGQGGALVDAEGKA